MKRILISALAAIVLSPAAFAGPFGVIDDFNSGTNPEEGYGYGRVPDHSGYVPPAVQPTPAAKSPYRFYGATSYGPLEYQRDKPGEGASKAVVSASCDYDQRGNVPAFGLCAENGEMLWDRDGRSYRLQQRATWTACPAGAEFWHTGPCYSGQ